MVFRKQQGLEEKKKRTHLVRRGVSKDTDFWPSLDLTCFLVLEDNDGEESRRTSKLQ